MQNTPQPNMVTWSALPFRAVIFAVSMKDTVGVYEDLYVQSSTAVVSRYQCTRDGCRCQWNLTSNIRYLTPIPQCNFVMSSSDMAGYDPASSAASGD